MRRWLIPGGIFVVIAGAAATLFFTVGNWLVVEDPLVHADVIVVLSGRLPERAVEAARVYKAGYADQVWISPRAFSRGRFEGHEDFLSGRRFL